MSELLLYDKKLKKDSELAMWFYFAGPESFALSSLGYLTLFKEIDETDDIDIERIYSDTKTTRIMRNCIDLIGVSFSFDFDFIKVFEFIEKNNYELKAAQRKEDEPLIYAGGPVVSANPQPYSEIFDFFVIGDGEEINIEIARICKTAKQNNLSKKETLKEISKLDGIYVPQFFDNKTIVKRTKKLDKCIYTPILSDKAFFKNTFIIELERGCANRCGFCLASYLNLPIRFVPYEEIISAIDTGLKYTNKIALLGAQVTAHPQFNEICNYIKDKIQNGEKIEMSVSSLRVDAFKPNIVSTLTMAGQKNLTLAIEAGSERLRKIINKNITEEQIFAAVDTAVKCGLNGIKFYTMIGLPKENMQDIKDIVTLAQKLKAKYKGFKLSFGVSTFVPKAHTPFQFNGREDEKSLSKKADYLKKELHKIGAEVSISSVKWDYYQAVLSRGDNTLTDYLIDVYRQGGKLGAFKNCAKKFNIDTNYYANQTYSYEQDLPWDFIEVKPYKNFLAEENKRLLSLN